MVKKFKGSAQKVRRAQSLLQAAVAGPAWTDAQIAEAVGCRTKTVENLRERLVTLGFEVSLDGKSRAQPPLARQQRDLAQFRGFAPHCRIVFPAPPGRRYNPDNARGHRLLTAFEQHIRLSLRAWCSMSINDSLVSSSGSVTQFFGQLRNGDPAAAGALWERFFPRLVALARRTLAGRPQRVADADDAAQSAFASFCLRVRAGEFAIGDRDDLWNLLGVITVNKARMQARREAAAKRGGGRVVGEEALTRPDGSPLPLEEAAVMPPADFDGHCEELLNRLEPELREFAVLRLLGYRNREIAEMHNCTERKVERKLNLIRLRWESEWLG